MVAASPPISAYSRCHAQHQVANVRHVDLLRLPATVEKISNKISIRWKAIMGCRPKAQCGELGIHSLSSQLQARCRACLCRNSERKYRSCSKALSSGIHLLQRYARLRIQAAPEGALASASTSNSSAAVIAFWRLLCTACEHIMLSRRTSMSDGNKPACKSSMMRTRHMLATTATTAGRTCRLALTPPDLTDARSRVQPLAVDTHPQAAHARALLTTSAETGTSTCSNASIVRLKPPAEQQVDGTHPCACLVL